MYILGLEGSLTSHIQGDTEYHGFILELGIFFQIRSIADGATSSRHKPDRLAILRLRIVRPNIFEVGIAQL